MRRLTSCLLTAIWLTSVAGAQGGLFAELHRALPRDADNTFALVAADVDGDGDLDAFTGARLLVNAGDGVFVDGSERLPAASASGVSSAALADVDGDGDLDAVLATFGFGANPLYLNDGAGTFTVAPAGQFASSDDAAKVAFGDPDGDGDADVWLAPRFGSVRFFRNDGTGTFQDDSASLPASVNGVVDIAVAELTGDAHEDVLLAAFGQTYLFASDGLGGFVDLTVGLPATGSSPQALALLDLEGDGDLDFVVALAGGQNLLFENDGAGVFSDVSAQLPSVNDFTLAIAAGDVDADGDDDIVLSDDFDASWLASDGSGTFALRIALEPTGTLRPSAFALFDVDADGDSDLYVGDALFSGLQDRLFLNDGGGGLVDVTVLSSIPTNEQRTETVAVGDVNGDGEPDLFLGNSAGGPSGATQADRLLLGDGLGRFADASDRLPALVVSTHDVELGDLDGDGDLDAFLGFHEFFGPGQNRVYLNDGTGTFGELAGALPVVLDRTRAVALGDWDGDGDLDGVIGNGTDFANRLVLNDGAGFFTEDSARLPATDLPTNDFAVGDWNVDGAVDLVLANGLSTLNGLYTNAGAGGFADDSGLLPDHADSTFSVALGDVEANGRLDLVFGNDGQDRLVFQDGAGVWVDATPLLPADTRTTTAIRLGDVDSDGDLDLVFGSVSVNSGPAPNRLARNDGVQGFVDASDELPAVSDRTRDLALFDGDGDGDLDLFVANGNPQSTAADGLANAWYANNTRQAVWRSWPRIGRTLALRVYGAAGEPWVLARSTGLVRIDVGPLGRLRLAPSGLRILASGVLPPAGRIELGLPVPTDVNLVGVTVAIQAALGAPARFSNADPLELSGL